MSKENIELKKVSITKQRNKSIKSLAIILVVILNLMFCFFITGCDDTPNYKLGNPANNFEQLHLLLNAGETAELDIEEIFKDSGINISSYKLESYDTNIATVKKNIITAQLNNGRTEIKCTLYDKGTQTKHSATVADIYTICEEKMIPITTAQELQDISLDLTGNYILKADIDLDGIDWMPIKGEGSPGINYNNISFSGSFINPDGFVIKNLTSNMGGIFGYTYRAYIDGIILENVNIDAMSDYIDVTDVVYLCRAGGIVGYAKETVILNCKVEGRVKALHNAGGLVGHCYIGAIRNCEFIGTVDANFKMDYANGWASAGGIVGELDVFLQDSLPISSVGIFDCKVNAEVISKDYAGGVVGYNYGYLIVNDCIFVGTVQGKMGQGELCGYSRW